MIYELTINNGIIDNRALVVHTELPKNCGIYHKTADEIENWNTNIPAVPGTMLYPLSFDFDATCYFYILTDVFCNLAYAQKKLQFDCVYISDENKVIYDRVAELVAKLEINKPIVSHRDVKCEKIVAADFHKPFNFPLFDYCYPNRFVELRSYMQQLRELFMPDSKKSDLAIYISRDYKADRSIVNEEEFINYVREHLYPNLLVYRDYNKDTIEQQAKLFSSASTVISPFGAGLTNALFCSPDTRIIELKCRSEAPQDCYLELFQIVEGLKHTVIFTDTFIDENRHQFYKNVSKWDRNTYYKRMREEAYHYLHFVDPEKFVEAVKSGHSYSDITDVDDLHNYVEDCCECITQHWPS